MVVLTTSGFFASIFHLTRVEKRVLTAIFCAIMPLIGNNKNSQLTAAAIFIAITIVGVIFANIWTKKK